MAIKQKIINALDGMANVINGLGTSVDRRMHNVWVMRHVQPEQIYNSYRQSWVMRRCIDLPATDMTKKGRALQMSDKAKGADIDTVDVIEATENQFKVWPKLREGVIKGMLRGGALIIGDGRPTEQPLGLIGKGRLQYLHMMSREDLTIGEMIRDITNPLYGEPEYFMLNTRQGGQVKIHPSRVIPFKGLPVGNRWNASWEEEYWGDPLFVSLRDAVDNAETVLNSLAGLVDRTTIDIFKFKGLSTLIGDKAGEEAAIRRIGYATQNASNMRAMVMDTEEEIERLTQSFTGMPEMMMAILSIVAAARGIPATKFMSKSPDGMNATGDGDARNYEDMIAEMQEAVLRPVLDRLDPVIFAHAGVSMDGVWWKFCPLSESAELQKADVASKKAAMVTQYANNGTVPMAVLEKVVPRMLEEDGTFPGIGQAMDEMESETAQMTAASAEADPNDPPDDDGMVNA